MKPIVAILLFLIPLALLPGAHRRPATRGDIVVKRAKPGKQSTAKVHRVVERRMVRGHWVKVSRMVRVNSSPAVQPHPDAERYQQIQKALADKGFFKGEVNGQWNADSVDALTRFQTNQNLNPDGKINALSIIGLGLGPKHEAQTGTPQ